MTVIEYERTSCQYTSNLKLRAKTGTSDYWYGLHVDDIAGRGVISSVEMKSSGDSDYSSVCAKDEGPSFWKCSGGYPLTAPLSVQLTNDNGEVLTCTDCITSTGASLEFDFGANFGFSVNCNNPYILLLSLRIYAIYEYG